MIKKIEVMVCDVCEDEETLDSEEESDFKKCFLCKKDVCSGCCSSVFRDVINSFIYPTEMYICEKCIEGNKLEKEIKKFFKSKEIKEDMSKVMDKLKIYLSKIAMLNSLEDKEDD